MPGDDVHRIDELAVQHRLNRTDYLILIRVGFGQLADPIKIEARFEQIHRRLDRIEQFTFG